MHAGGVAKMANLSMYASGSPVEGAKRKLTVPAIIGLAVLSFCVLLLLAIGFCGCMSRHSDENGPQDGRVLERGAYRELQCSLQFEGNCAPLDSTRSNFEEDTRYRPEVCLPRDMSVSDASSRSDWEEQTSSSAKLFWVEPSILDSPGDTAKDAHDGSDDV